MASRLRFFAILLALLVPVAAACSSSDSAARATTDDTSADEGSDEPAPTDSAAPDEIADEPLTASYQGVTETEIKMGVIGIDSEKLLDFGVDLGVVPLAEMYEAWASEVNEQGGIHGRDLVVDVRLHLPVGNEESDGVCTELTEDFEAFVVTGQMVADNMLCVTELHGLPFVGHFGMTAERDRRSEGRFIATEIGTEKSAKFGTQAMVDEGDLDGKKVAVYWGTDADKELADAAIAVLEANNVEVVEKLSIGEFGTDQIAAEAANDAVMQRIAASGADVLLAESNVTPPTEAVDRAGLDITIAFTNGQIADGFVFDDVVASESVKAKTFAITTNKPTTEESMADEGVLQCLSEFEAMFPDLTIDTTDPEDVFALVAHCRAFRLTVLALEASGRNPTPDTFVSGTAGLGKFTLPAMPNAEITAEKRDAGSSLRRYEYDAALGHHKPVGDAIPAS